MALSSHETPWTPFRLPRARRCVLRGGNGHDYDLALSVPDQPPPPGGYPLMVVLDGPALFATAAETERRLSLRPAATGVTPTVVLGVGPAGVDLYDMAQRHRDFTPGPPVSEHDRGPHETGGAGDFLKVLVDQVLPLAAAAAPVDPARRLLLGHSLAGYFTLLTLAERPGLFAAHAALSPSIWWDPGRLEHGLSALKPGAARVLLAVGQREQVEATDVPRRAARRMVEATRDLHRTLGAVLGPDAARLAVLEDEDHASVVSGGLTRALRLLGASSED